MKSKIEHVRKAKYYYFKCLKCGGVTAVTARKLNYFDGSLCECGGSLVPCGRKPPEAVSE